MTKNEIRRIIQEYTPIFKARGLIKEGGHFVTSKNIRVKLMLNASGWSDHAGAGFTVRLFDQNKIIDNLGNIHPKDTYDVRPFELLKRGSITIKDLDEISSDEPANVRKILKEGLWYQFYDELHLRRLLDRLLLHIIDEVDSWCSSR